MVRAWMLPLMVGGAYTGKSVADANGSNEVLGAVIGAGAGLAGGLALSGVRSLVRGIAHDGSAVSETATAAAREGADAVGRRGISPQELLIRRRIELYRGVDAFRSSPPR